MSQAVQELRRLLLDPQSHLLSWLILAGEVLLCAVIVLRVPCT